MSSSVSTCPTSSTTYGQRRRSFVRQYSDKYLKRRNQIENNHHQHNINQEMMMVDQHQYSNHHQNQNQSYLYQYQYQGAASSTVVVTLLHKKNTSIVIILTVIFIVCMLTSMSYRSSPMSTLPRKEQDSIDINNNNNRSYKDLADSIRRVRIRREKQDSGVGSTDDDESHNNKKGNNDHYADADVDQEKYVEEDIRLQHLEEKILLDQTRKVIKHHEQEQEQEAAAHESHS